MKSIIVAILSLLIVACESPKIAIENPLVNYIPEASSFIIRTENFNVFKSHLNNSSSFSNFIDSSKFKNSKALISVLQHIHTDQNAIVSLREIGKDYIDFLFVSNTENSMILNSEPSEQSTYENTIIKTFIINNISKETIIYSANIKGHVLYSASLLMIENAIRSQNQDKNLAELTNLFKASKTNAFYFALDKKSWLAKNNLIPFSNKDFGKWGVLNFNFENAKLDLYGFNTQNDSLPYFLNLFKDSEPQYMKSPELTPRGVEKTWMYGISNYEDFEIQQRIYLNRSAIADTLFKHIEEVSLLEINNSFSALLYFSDIQNTQTFLNKQGTKKEIFQGVEIFKLKNGVQINESFAPMLDKLSPNYSCLINQTLIVGNTLSDVQTIISNHNTQSTLSNDPVFIKNKESFAENANIRFYESHASPFTAKEPYEFLMNAAFKKNTVKILSSQWVADQGFFHQHLSISEETLEKDLNSVAPIFTVNLEAPLGNTLQWVKNHITKEFEIIAQDKNNKLYLIDNKGKLLWEKQLNSPIQGKIQQLDIYKNGRLQLAFTTQDQWLIIDRNAKEVSPFNKTFKGELLGPLAIFDYDNNKEYRFVFSQGKTIHMYDRNAAIVSGFSFKNAESDINEVPKHFRLKGKDYLVFKAINGQFLIKNRTGETRVKINKKYKFSDNEVFLYEGYFSFTDLEGNLIQINQEGVEKFKNLKVNATHKIAALKDQLVVLEDNILYSNGKKASLDFGIYTAPKIFEIGKTFYISVTDIQNQKVYLFNKTLEPLAGFPVFGIAAIDLIAVNEDENTALLTQNNKNTLIVYSIKKTTD